MRFLKPCSTLTISDDRSVIPDLIDDGESDDDDKSLTRVSLQLPMRSLKPCSTLTISDDRNVIPDLIDDGESDDDDDKSLTRVSNVANFKRWFLLRDKPHIFLTLTCNSEWVGIAGEVSNTSTVRDLIDIEDDSDEDDA